LIWCQDERVDLTEFLTARLDEDEAAANRGIRFAEGRERDCPDAELVEMCERASRRERNYDQPWWAATVMALRQQVQLAPHDPARVLREVAAKRAIMERHRPITRRPGWRSTCRFDNHRWPCADVLDQAAAYSDHPDYRDEWRP
jgi:hypothetical protein